MENPKKFDSNPLQCNTYVYLDGKNRAMVVESSGQIDEVVQYLQTQKVNQVLLAYTHGHFDHVSYGHAMQAGLREAGIEFSTVAPSLDARYFKEEGQKVLEDSLQYFQVVEDFPNAQIPHVDTFLNDGEALGFLDFVLISTPGHTEGSSCFYSAEKKLMFSGDTVFAGGSAGRTDLPGGSAEDLVQSLQKISSYPLDVVIYPGHGPQDTLDRACKALGLA